MAKANVRGPDKRFTDITGKSFGRLVAVEFVGISGGAKWRCKCDCGKELVVASASLRSGNTRSCGCLLKGARIIDISGEKFARWTVLEFSHTHSRTAFWRCQCECGTVSTVKGSALRKGQSKSCGCLQKERVCEAITTHGYTHSSEYYSWQAMIQRCLNPNNPAYHNYGQRGITVCAKWRTFDGFIEDMGPKPTLEHTIDRYPDQNGNYEAGNCRWATRAEQNRNRRDNRLVTHNGVTKTAKQWSRQVGVSHNTIVRRIEKGWSHSDALFVPGYGAR